MKTTIAVIVGYAVWTAVWLAGNAGFRAVGITPKDPAVKVESAGSLLALLALSMVASVVGGYLGGLVSPSRTGAYICVVLLVATGIAVQWSVRSLFPLWYHSAFLLLLVPLFLSGGHFAKGS